MKKQIRNVSVSTLSHFAESPSDFIRHGHKTRNAKAVELGNHYHDTFGSRSQSSWPLFKTIMTICAIAALIIFVLR